jgi:hypothetical protein
MRHSVCARFLLTLVCATSVLALPAAAAASNNSPVHVDPSSPVAKEYALPLATARGAPPESGKNGSLFGSGIKHSTSPSTAPHTTTTTEASPPVQTVVSAPATPPAATTTAAQTATTQTATTKHHQPGHILTVTLPDLPVTPTGSRPVTASAAPAAYKVLKPGSGSGVLWMVLAAALVVVLGSAGGIALSRRR